MPRSPGSTGLDTRAGVWDRLAALAQAGKAAGSPLDRERAARAIERAGWNLIAERVFDGALTFAAAQAMFTRLQQLVDAANCADLPSAFMREGLEEARQPLAVRVQQYLDAHAERRVSLHEVAHAVGASVRQTGRQFHRCSGFSVQAYLTRRRVIHATRLLAETDVKVEAIARLAGFGHKTSLYRHFSRLLGSTPGSVRQRRTREAAVDEVESLLMKSPRPAGESHG